MGIGVVGGRRGIVSELNVVPLIDILLVLLVIFMLLPHKQVGLQANLPRETSDPGPLRPAETIIVQIASDGKIRVNQTQVEFSDLRERLEWIFARRADRVAFLKGDDSLEFVAVARVLDVMQ